MNLEEIVGGFIDNRLDLGDEIKTDSQLYDLKIAQDAVYNHLEYLSTWSKTPKVKPENYLQHIWNFANIVEGSGIIGAISGLPIALYDTSIGISVACASSVIGGLGFLMRRSLDKNSKVKSYISDLQEDSTNSARLGDIDSENNLFKLALERYTTKLEDLEDLDFAQELDNMDVLNENYSLLAKDIRKSRKSLGSRLFGLIKNRVKGEELLNNVLSQVQECNNGDYRLVDNQYFHNL